ncbi:DUF4976 domain-containing protein [Puteibacter caeruleilacunae]|nr:DUF4976 domain-containing protein [Puteibacter caeruleilacunae]
MGTKAKESKYQIKGKVPKNAKARKIVFIMTDSQRYDMLGSVKKAMKTPFLDKLAEEGTRFDQAYSVSPVCGPARSSIFTGTYPSTNGVWGNNMGLADNIKTIGQRLSDNGFHTAYMGKWHLDGTDYFGNGMCPDGWNPEYWYDMRMYLDELSDEEKLKSRMPESNEQDVDETFTFGHRVADRAIKFLDNHGDEDFMIVASFDEPHHPFLCPEPYASMYKDYEWPKTPAHFDSLKNKPHYQQLWAEGRQFEDKNKKPITHPYFFGVNSYIDYEIGRIVEKIDKVCPDALIIYTSDHGDFLEAHSLKKKGPAIYDDVARIPFIVRWKDHVPAGKVSDQLMSHLNVVPTILDAAGLDIPDFMHAGSALKTLYNPDEKCQDEIFMEFGRFETNHDGFGAFQPLRAVYDGRYKLSINMMSTDELYDMKNDPHEVNNLINYESLADVRKKLHRKILDRMGDTRDNFRGVYWEDRHWNKGFEQTWEYTTQTRSRKDDGYQPRMRDYNTGMDIKEYVRGKIQDKKG